MKLLLLSNSTNFGENYMQWCKKTIAHFVANHHQNIVFINYAAASFPLQAYTHKVNEALHELNISVSGMEQFENPKIAVANATAIFVGGGNTFQLLKLLQENDLISTIRKKVGEGTPYIGWSAGSNVASPTICTTNDMPIVQPKSFESLNLLSFQINPHYTELTLPNHGGETRKQRLQEYLFVNQDKHVVCLPESSYLSYLDGNLMYFGSEAGKILTFDREKVIENSELLPLS